MRPLRSVACRLAYASLVVVALTTGGARDAAAVPPSPITVAVPPNPNVMLLIDSSGSMENWSDGTPDGQPAAPCVADLGQSLVLGNVCQTKSFPGSGGLQVSAQNKWAGVIQALSGSAVQQPGSEANGYFTWYEMARKPVSAFANEYSLGGQQIYDVNYALNYHRMASWDASYNHGAGTWCVLSPKTLPNGGNSLGVGSPPSFVGASPDSWSTSYMQGLIPAAIWGLNGSNLPGPMGPCTWTLNGDGNIDAVRDQVRFGLMTFDNNPDQGTQVTVTGAGIQSSFPSVGAATWGLWSYYPGWNGTGSTPPWSAGLPPLPGTDQSMTPYAASPACWSLGSASPSCTLGPYELGARNPAAPPWEGRMVPFPNGVAPLTEQEANNDEVKLVLAATRPYGATPIAGMLTDARNYFRYDPNGPEQSDPYVNTVFAGGHGCRPQYIILLTDGGFNLDERPYCAPGGPSPTETCPFQPPEQIAGDLCVGGGGGAFTGGCKSASFDAVTTFVIGYSLAKFTGPSGMTTCSQLVGTLGNSVCASGTNPCGSALGGTFGTDPTGAPDANACCNLINIACDGSAGTQAPYFADSAADLNQAFSSILSKVSRASSSHVVPVFASASPVGGNFQSEFFSAGFQTSPVEPLGTAPVPWSGTITRTQATCPSGSPATQTIPDTSATTLRNYFALRNTLGAPADDTGTFRPFYSGATDGFGVATTNTTEVFATQVSPTSTLPILVGNDGGNTSQGPFKLTDFSCPADPTTGARLDAVDCEKYVLGFWAGLSPADGTTSTLSSPDFPGPLSGSYQYVKRTAAWLGPVLNSAPAYVTAPSLALTDNTYRTFAQTYASRPNVLYVETTDGVLHALNADYKIPNTPSSSTDLSAVQELWAFLPPAVSPNLAGNLPGASRPLLDGSPVVADTVFGRTTSTGVGTSQFDWHTSLVSSFGAGGPGYFALDVTHPQLTDHPTTPSAPSAPSYPTTTALDGPHFLWQLTGNGSGSAAQVFGSHGATPAITTLYVKVLGAAAQETGVAILPGGSDGQAPTGICLLSPTLEQIHATVSDSASPRTILRAWGTPPTSGSVLDGTTPCDNFGTPNGRAVTIVRISDGAVIATFANPVDNANLNLSTTGPSAVVKAYFTAPMTGTPAIYPNGGGRLATQAYISDADGQIWKLNLSGPDPTQWSASRFFDAFNTLATSNAPTGTSGLGGAILAANLGQQLTAAPILSIGPDSSLVLNFATGDQTLFSTSTFQAGSNLSLATIPIENFVYSISDISSGGTPSVRLNWFAPFDSVSNTGSYKQTTTGPLYGSSGNVGERVTGPMAVYASSLYFATLWPGNGTEVCSAGEARIYGMDYFYPQAPCTGSLSTSSKACGGAISLYDIPANDGTFTDNSGNSLTSTTTAGAVIPGVAVTQVQPCVTSSTPAPNNYFAGSSTQYSAVGTQQPQLTFMTTSSGGSSSLTGTSVANGRKALSVPRQPTRIDSWAHVIN